MKYAVLLAILLPCAPAAAQQQSTPSGHITYGGTKTISCLQAGKVIMQYPRVWAVELTWARENNSIHFRMPDGLGKDFNFNSANMTCLIEDMGQESVPLLSKPQR